MFNRRITRSFSIVQDANHFEAVARAQVPRRASLNGRLNMRTPEPNLWPRLQNIVSTFTMSCQIDLKNLAQHARNCEYRPNRFAAAIVRIRDPKTTCLVFSNGKCVVTGAKSIDDSRLAARKYVRIVQKLGYRPHFQNFKVVNLVAGAAALPQIATRARERRQGIVCQREFISLDGFAHKHHRFANYTPEIFAGCVYRIMEPAVCLLIFANGKIVFTGARRREDLDEAYRLIVPGLLSEFFLIPFQLQTKSLFANMIQNSECEYTQPPAPCF